MHYNIMYYKCYFLTFLLFTSNLNKNALPDKKSTNLDLTKQMISHWRIIAMIDWF